MTDSIFLVEATARDPAAGADTVLRLASGAGHVTRPSETPANAVWEPRLIVPGNFERRLYGARSTGGVSKAGRGPVIANNADGGLDGLRGLAFDGRPLVVRRGPAGGVFPAQFPALFTGTCEQAEVGWRRVTLRVRDRQAEIADKAVQPILFAGDNAPPAGVEGTATDLGGKPKPVLFGRALNFAPPMVNGSRLIWQVSVATGRPITVLAVYDQGAALVPGAQRADLAALHASTPALGAWDWCAGPEGAFVRLGSPPAGALTCDAAEGAVAADRSVARLLRALMTGPGGLPAGDLDEDSISDLHALNPAEAGLWLGTQERELGQVLDDLCRSIGAWWMPDRDGRFRVGRLEAPDAGAAVATLEAWQVLDRGGVEILAGRDKGAGLPVWRVRAGYGRNFTLMRESEVAGGVSLERKAWLAEELRQAVAEDQAVRDLHPLAAELEVQTLLLDRADAEAEAARLLALHGVGRDHVELRLPAAVAATIDLAQVVIVKLPRFGWQAGKAFRVLGLVEDLEHDGAVLELWG